METTVFERHTPKREVITESLTNTKQAPYWLDTLSATSYPSLRSNHSTDLLIIGGGYCGLWTAVRAKERYPHLDVVLIESHTIGWAASGRNGGFCEASLTHGESNGLARWPEEFETLEQMGHQNLDDLEATVLKYSMDVDFERTGVIAVATEQHQVEWISEEQGFLDLQQIQTSIKSPTYLAGVFDESGCAIVNPAKLAAELARVATDLGVKIYEHTPALKLVGSDKVLIPEGMITTKKSVLATNAFKNLLKRNSLMTVPVYDYVLMTEPLSSEQMASIGWEGRQGLADMSNQFHYYRLSADNRILFGGYDAVYNFGGKVDEKYEDRSESFEKLASHFFTTFPQLVGLRFTHKWAGAIDTCSRFCAYFGTARKKNIAYALGFTGLGVGATRFAGDVMLDLLYEKTTERTKLKMVRTKPTPFPPEPIASIGINMVKWAMNRADHNKGKRNLLLKTLDALGLGFDS